MKTIMLLCRPFKYFVFQYLITDGNNFVAVVYNAQSIDPNGIVSLQAEYYNGL